MTNSGAAQKRAAPGFPSERAALFAAVHLPVC